jgi:hypothetical protein
MTNSAAIPLQATFAVEKFRCTRLHTIRAKNLIISVICGFKGSCAVLKCLFPYAQRNFPLLSAESEESRRRSVRRPARAEDGGADSHMSGAKANRLLEIGTHAHAEDSEPGAPGDFAQQRKMQRRLLV